MKRALILTFAAALAGCAVGPDFHSPAAPASNAYAPQGPSAIAGQTLQADRVVDAQWWRAFGSLQLDAMVDEALKANPDLKSADAALRQARALLAVQRGAFWPQVEADYLGQRAKTSNALAPVPADNQSIYSLHTAQVTVSYAPDVFGGVRRGSEAAKAQAEAARFQYDAARTSLIANVVAAAFQEAALREELDAANHAAEAGRDILAFSRRQAELGGLGQADVAAQETVLAQAEQAVPPLRKALAQQRTALAILLGREPGQAPPPEVSLDAVILPADLPMILPSQLVRRRPDVRAAEANLHAASAQVGVAIAARIPNITLSATGGGSSLNLGSLLTQPNQFWTLSAGVTQPIFAGGALLGRQKVAEAGLDQAKAQYRSTVLTALKNTADSLDALAVDADALTVAVKADGAARRSLDFAQRQMTLGQVGALQARTAQQAQAQAAASLALARAARFADTAALYQALGGGWSDRATSGMVRRLISLRSDMRRIALACVGLVILAGCQVGPNYATAPAPTVAGYTPAPLPQTTTSAPVPGGGAQAFVFGQDVDGRWWTLYGSPQLDALVDQALKASPDLKAAQAALRVAREAWYAQRGAALPTVDAGYNASRQQVSAALASPLDSNVDLFTLHTVQLNIGYTPDVFGALRRQSEGAQAQAEAQRFQTEAAYLTLTSNVVAAAVQQASLAQQIRQTGTIIAADRTVLDLMRQQQRLGEISTADVALQAALVAQAEQTMPPLQKALAQQNDLLADLTGHFPSQFTPPTLDLATMKLPAELPMSLPSKLVEQRPDIRAAAANVHAASAQVGAAIAARLPSFPLTISGGGQSTDFPGLFSSQNLFYALTGAVVAPIYEGGQLKHKQRGAEAALDQAKAQYQSTVLSAFQNVADSLQALQADARTLQAAATARAAAIVSMRLARAQFENGQSTSLALLAADQAEQQAELSVTQAQAARYADTAALYQALGGGWWNRTDIDLAQMDRGVRPGR